MEGNSVLDGDVGCNSNDDEDGNENPETSFSYMDEKIQNLLGHFQKDFEGGGYADNLGPKYGAYGSFLLSEEGSPSFESNKGNNIQNSHSTYPSKITINEMKQNSKLGAAEVECSAIHKPATDLLSSVKKADVKDGNTILLISNSDKRSLKLRIKVGSYGKIPTPTINSAVAVIKSSSPSFGHNFEGDDRIFREANTIDNESPATMLQVMASFPVRKDALLSPLPESVLCFVGKKSSNNDRLENNGRKLSLNNALITLKKRKRSLRKDTISPESSLKVNNEKNSDVIGQKFSCIKDSSSEPSQNIERLSNKVTNKKFLDEHRSDLGHNNCRRYDVFQGTNVDGDGERAETFRRHDRESSKLKSSCISDKRLSTSRTLMSKKNFLAESDDKKAKKRKLVSLSKDSLSPSSTQGDAKENQNRTSSLSVDDETILDEDKTITRKRKYSFMPSSQNYKHEPVFVMNKKPAMKGEQVIKAKNSYKSLTEISRFSKSSEQSDISEMDLNSSAFSSHKGKKKFYNKGARDLDRQNILDSEHPLIKDGWVMCDGCDKWRLLPSAITPNDLPKNWLCSMLDWLPGMNSCDISEDETTKALCAKNQISPDVVLTYHRNYKDSGRASASVIKENKRTYDEKTQASTKSAMIRKENHLSQKPQNITGNVPSVSGAETRAEKHTGDGSFDDCKTRRKTKKSVLHGISEVSRNSIAKGFGRNASVDSSSQKKSIFLPHCSRNEVNDSKKRILLSFKVKETRAPDANSSDLRAHDVQNSEIKSRGYSDSSIAHPVCEKGTIKSKCTEKFNFNAGCNATVKKKLTPILCSSASKAYEFNENGNKNPDKFCKVSADEKLHCPSNLTKDTAEDDFDTNKERLNDPINDQRRHATLSPVIASGIHKLNHLEDYNNEDSKKEPKTQIEPSDLSALSSAIVTSSAQAASEVLKEAQILRDRGDRFRDSGFAFEGNETYFEAALKFLHGAYLLDSSTSEATKSGDIAQYQAYNAAAQLCKCCTKEYERINDMASSALAYKCMEVAYWNMVYWRNPASSRDRTELQANLQLVPSGDSPTSSASYVDNLNNPNPRDRGASVLANALIPEKCTSQFRRLLDYTRDAGAAVESSKRAQSALVAAEAAAERAQKKQCLASVRTALNFSFQGVDRFVEVVLAATKEVNRSGLCLVQE